MRAGSTKLHPPSFSIAKWNIEVMARPKSIRLSEREGCNARSEFICFLEGEGWDARFGGPESREVESNRVEVRFPVVRE